jgi:hypothetical protein
MTALVVMGSDFHLRYHLDHCSFGTANGLGFMGLLDLDVLENGVLGCLLAYRDWDTFASTWVLGYLSSVVVYIAGSDIKPLGNRILVIVYISTYKQPFGNRVPTIISRVIPRALRSRL